MSLLSYPHLVRLVKANVITGVSDPQINATSIDLTLGRKVMFENTPTIGYNSVSLRKRDKLIMGEWDLEENSYFLAPGEFILAHSQQEFNLPNNISAEYKLKSSMARIGLEHLNAGWCDAGWHGSVLTLELKNMTRNHNIILNYGDLIGQVVFFRHDPVPEGKDYAARGRYNNDKTVEGVKQ